MGGGEPLEELITLQQLKKLKDIFDNADSGSFTTDQFVHALRHVMPAVPEAQVREWFGRIDLTGLGVLNWGEFSGYLVQRNHHKVVQEESRFEYQKQTETSKILDEHHRDMITCTLAHPVSGKVYTCGRDGIVKQWNQTTLQHERILHNAGTWITAGSFYRQGTRLVVASMDRQLNVFDVASGNLVTTYAGRKHASERKEVHRRKPLNDTSKYGIKVDFPRQPRIAVDSSTTLEDFTSQMRKNMAGQERGSFEVAITPLCNLSSPPMSMCCVEDNRESVALGLQDGSLQLYPLEPNADGMCPPVFRHGLHSDAVSKLDYAPSLKGFISSSWDKTLQIFSVEREKSIQTFGGAHGHQKAVFTFDWSKELSSVVIASVGSERRVYIWEPRVVKPVFKIDGHQQPLVSVALNHPNHQLITLSQDKCIKVWDVRTYRCIQAITDTANYHPDNYISSMCYDEPRERIITSATCPTSWTASKVSTQPGGTAYTGHTTPIVEVLYNQKLKQTLSADRHQIVLWDPDTGERLFHCRLSKQLPQNHQRLGHFVAKATSDQRGTRLITGTEKGAVVMWNLQNCQVCAVGENPDDPKECTALLHCQRKERWYVVAALGATLHIFEDADDVHQLRMVGRCTTHRYGAQPTAPPSIASMALATQSMIALGLDDGRILLYSPDIDRFCGVLPNPHNSAVERLYLAAPQMLLCAQTDGTISFFDLRARQAVLSVSALQGMDGTLSTLALSTDLSHVIVGDSEGSVRVWRVEYNRHVTDETLTPEFAPVSPDALSGLSRISGGETASARQQTVTFRGVGGAAGGVGFAGVSPEGVTEATSPLPLPSPMLPVEAAVTSPASTAEGMMAMLQPPPPRRFSEGPPPAALATTAPPEHPRSPTEPASDSSPSASPQSRPAASPAREPVDIPSAAASDGSVTLTHKCTFKAHTDTVTSIVNVNLRPPATVIVTGGLDCQVKAFTLRGVHIGTFGSGVWNTYRNETWALQSTELTTKRVNMSHTSTSFFTDLLRGITQAERAQQSPSPSRARSARGVVSPRGGVRPSSAQTTPRSQRSQALTTAATHTHARASSLARDDLLLSAIRSPDTSVSPRSAYGGGALTVISPISPGDLAPSVRAVTAAASGAAASPLRIADLTIPSPPATLAASNFLVPCPPRRGDHSFFEEITPPVGVSPGRHIQRRNRRRCPLVKRRRLKCIPMVAGAVCVAAVSSVVCELLSFIPPLPPPSLAAHVGTTFLTELVGGGGAGAAPSGSLTARGPSERDVAAMRQRVEQRWLARHGQALTARGGGGGGGSGGGGPTEWVRLDRGADVLRQLRRRKAKQIEANTDPSQWGRFAAVIKKDDVKLDIPRPKIANPRPLRRDNGDEGRGGGARRRGQQQQQQQQLNSLPRHPGSAMDFGGDDPLVGPGHGPL